MRATVGVLISDADGLENVSYSYQWLADDADIDGATNLRDTFTDDADNEESLTRAGRSAVVMVGL